MMGCWVPCQSSCLFCVHARQSLLASKFFCVRDVLPTLRAQSQAKHLMLIDCGRTARFGLINQQAPPSNLHNDTRAGIYQLERSLRPIVHSHVKPGPSVAAHITELQLGGVASKSSILIGSKAK